MFNLPLFKKSTTKYFYSVSWRIVFMFAMFFVFMSDQVYAQGNVRQSINQIVSAGNRESLWTQIKAESIFVQIGDFTLFAGVAILIIMLIWTGVSYLSIGSDEQKAQQAKARLKWTLVGSVIIMGFGAIIRIITSIILKVSL